MSSFVLRQDQLLIQNIFFYIWFNNKNFLKVSFVKPVFNQYNLYTFGTYTSNLRWVNF